MANNIRSTNPDIKIFLKLESSLDQLKKNKKQFKEYLENINSANIKKKVFKCFTVLNVGATK